MPNRLHRNLEKVIQSEHDALGTEGFFADGRRLSCLHHLAKGLACGSVGPQALHASYCGKVSKRKWYLGPQTLLFESLDP